MTKDLELLELTMATSRGLLFLITAMALAVGGEANAQTFTSCRKIEPGTECVGFSEMTYSGTDRSIPARPSSSFVFSNQNFSASFSFTPARQASAHGMVVAGSIVFGATYGVALLTSLVGGDTGLEGAGWYAVPVVGPFAWSIEYGIHGDMPRTTTAFHTVWTGAQTAGLIMLFSGLQHL